MEQKSFSKNVLTCVLASIIVGASYARINRKFFSHIIPMPVAIGLAGLFFLATVVFCFVWYRKEKNNAIDSERILALWQGLLRYGLAFELCTIGWQKIFHLQFVTPIGRLDNPLSSFSTIDLMWAFFGQSYSFILIIGVIQITGSFMLLFSRTRLFAVFILLPVMINIVLIDILYEIEPGPLAQAILLTCGILYFLFIEYDRLKAFFFSSKNDLPSIRMNSKLMKYVIRFSVVIIPLVIILTNKELAPFVYDRTPLPAGRYEVRQLSINQKDFGVNNGCDSVLSIVYLKHDVVFQFGDVRKRTFGLYTYDENTKQMKAVWHYPPSAAKDTLVATVIKKDKDVLLMDGRLGKNLIQMELVKTPAPKFP
jgi:hypothetical protein